MRGTRTRTHGSGLRWRGTRAPAIVARMPWTIALDPLPIDAAPLLAGLIEARVGAPVLLAGDRLEATLPDRPPADLVDAIAGWFTLLGLGDVRVQSREGDGAWRDGLPGAPEPVRITDDLELATSFVSAPPADGVRRVVIDALRAFGGGAHPTTRLAAALVDDLAKSSRTALDVGCGSGVLSVIAAKRGARVVAFDVDPHVTRETARNALRNAVAEQITCFAGTLDAVTGTFDLVAANLYLELLERLAPGLAARTGQRLALSGLRAEEIPTARALFPTLRETRRLELDGWAALAFERTE